MIQTKGVIRSKISKAICNLNEEVKHWSKSLQEYLGFGQTYFKSNTNGLPVHNARRKEKATVNKPVAKRMTIKFETRRHWQPKVWR